LGASGSVGIAAAVPAKADCLARLARSFLTGAHSTVAKALGNTAARRSRLLPRILDRLRA
jgi:hypothetical protein